MKKYRILLPTPMTSNPYVFQLIRSLQLHKDIEVVQYGIQWLKDTQFRFDVVHIQWPEFLAESQEPRREDLNNIESAFIRWKKQNTRIVATVHNTQPHLRKGKLTSELYKLVYSYCDSIIHFGNESVSYFKENFYSVNQNANQSVIPHGNYTWFRNDMTRQEARDQLRIDDHRFMVLSMGAIRSYDELMLLKRTARILKQMDGVLYVAGQLMVRSRFTPQYYSQVLPFLRTRNVRVNPVFIPDDEVQKYLHAADTLIVPRINALNSGNVALGFTFGKIVTGCDYGVIGEELKNHGNPVFDPISDASIQKAIEQALEKQHTDTGLKNQRYALTELDWSVIADKHVRVYDKIRQVKQPYGNTKDITIPA
jgi:beta-1,4-mannosyltransferase